MPTSSGYPVSQIVNVTVNLSPVAAATRNFGATLAVGSSDVIDTTERIRPYASLTEVGADFGNNAPEYKAAMAFFGQSPKPSIFYIGRWAQTATKGRLSGGALSAADQALANFTVIAAGKLTINVDGLAHVMVGIDFSGVANMNAVAAVITAKLGVVGTCTWDAPRNRFLIESATTGALSTVAFPTVVVGDEGVSEVMKLNQADGASTVDGIAAESLDTAVDILAMLSSAWYFVGIAATGAGATDADMPAVANVVEALDPVRFAGFTTQNANTLNPADNTDLASVLKAAAHERAFVQYSSSNPYAVFSIMGRGATIDFDGAQTEITYKFKQQPGITAENLTTAQYAALKAKRCNVFIQLNNDTQILQEGVCSGPYFIDEVQGTDWLANDIQVAAFNALYTTNKIPQTDQGVGQIMGAVSSRCAQAVTNGLAAPGYWTAPGFGPLNEGDFLPNGFLVWAPPLVTQSQADREARISPTIMAALKLAGAIHFVVSVVNTNR